MAPVTGPLPSATARGKALRREISALGVTASCDAADLWAASRDCSAAALLWTKARAVPHPPDVVVWPEDVEQVSAVVRFAAERQVPVVPAGGGTGSAGGAVAVRGGIVLDTKRLTRPLHVDLLNCVAEVGAGTIGQRLEETLAQAGATRWIRCSPAPGRCAFRSRSSGWWTERRRRRCACRCGRHCC